jgi:HIV Tat-specific factor 1
MSFCMMYALALLLLFALIFSLSQKEPEGIITVKFRDPLSAQACVLVRTTSFVCQLLIITQKMDGRFFDKRRVEAELFTGRQRFKRSGAGDDIEGGGRGC